MLGLLVEWIKTTAEMNYKGVSVTWGIHQRVNGRDLLLYG